jgi:predicted nucleic acid-binding protein
LLPSEKNVAESRPTYFLDTSALAKLYHHEAGSRLVEAWAADDTTLLWISDLARAELHSALIRKVREGELTEEALHGVLECFRVDLLHRFYIMPLTAMVLERAINLLLGYGKRYPLRTLDALQLASAQAVHGERLTFVTADSKLFTIASVIFSQVLNPEIGDRDPQKCR